MWKTKQCKKCLRKELVTFLDLDVIEDVAYRMDECEKCGYWELRDHNSNLIKTGYRQPIKSI